MGNENPYSPPESPVNVEVIPLWAVRVGWLRFLIGLQIFVIIAGLLIEAWDHASIVWTGPPFAIVGAAIFIAAMREEDRMASYFGASAVAFAILIASLIIGNRWGPAQGDGPISVLCYLYSGMAIPFAMLLNAAQNGFAYIDPSGRCRRVRPETAEGRRTDAAESAAQKTR